MEITRIKLNYKEGEKSKADFSITFNHCLTINFGNIIEDKNSGMKFIAFPFTQIGDDWQELMGPISKDVKNEIAKRILDLYDKGVNEYVKVTPTESCKVTEINCKLINEKDGIFETDIVLNNYFRIQKILMRKDGNNYAYQYPYSQKIDGKMVSAISFDSDELKSEVIQKFAEWFLKNYTNENYATSALKTPEERRKKSNEKIKSQGIACYENLMVRENGKDITLKNLDVICKKIIATLLAIQVACDINNGRYQESVEFFSEMLEKFDVKDCLNKKEKRIFEGTYSKQDVIDIDWEYETYWSIIWALGLIDSDISDASKICDCQKACSCVIDSTDYEEFKSKCKMKSIEEIMDMLDLYYRYDWAVTEKRIKPDTPIGKLNSSVVVERRRGLEWLISDMDDWYDLSLNT